MIKQDPTLTELLKMIDLYFDCSLSDANEDRLRVIIAETTLSHPAIDDARALMGFRIPKTAVSTAPQPSKEVRKNHISPRAIISIAAAIAVVFAIGLHLSIGNPTFPQTTQCIAYVNGERITDETDVVRLLTEDLREFNDGVEEADRDLNDELNIIAPVIEDYESPMPLI